MSSNNNFTDEVDYFTNLTKIYKLIEEAEWKEVAKICAQSPKNSAADKWVVRKGKDGSLTWRRLPLHEACIRNPTENAVMRLIDAYPDGVRGKDQNGRIPLHHACVHGASAEVVEALLCAFPESVEVEDVWGKTPVSTAYASASENKNKVIRLLDKGAAHWVNRREEKKLSVIAEKQKVAFDLKMQAIDMKHRNSLCVLEQELVGERLRAADLEGKLESTQSREKSAEQFIAKLEKKIKKDEETINTLKEDKVNLKESVRQLNVDVNSFLGKIKELDVRVKGDTETIEKLRRSLLNEQKRADDLEQKVEAVVNIMSTIPKNVTPGVDIETAIKELIDQINTSQAEVVNANTQIDGYKATITQLEEAAESQKENMREQIATLKATIAEKDNTIHEVALSKAKMDIITSKKITTYETAAEDYARTITEKEKTISELNIQLAATSDILTERDAKISTLEQTVSTLNDTITAAYDKTTASESRVAELESRVSELNSTASDLQSRLEESKRVIARLESGVAESDAIARRTADEMLGLKVAAAADASEIESLKNDISDQTLRIEKLETTLGDCGLKFSQLSSKFSKIVKVHDALVEGAQKQDVRIQSVGMDHLKLANAQEKRDEIMKSVEREHAKLLESMTSQKEAIHEAATDLDDWLSYSFCR